MNELFFFLFFMAWIGLAIYLIRFAIKFSGISRQIKRFTYQVDDEAVIELIVKLNNLGKLPNYPSAWDSMRAGFELVNQSSNVSDHLKQELRNVLLGLGVNRLPKVYSRRETS